MKRRSKLLLGVVVVGGAAALALLGSTDADAADSLGDGDESDEGYGGDATGDSLGGTPTSKKPPKLVVPAAPGVQTPKKGALIADGFESELHEKDYPTPGYFYQVKNGDMFGGELSQKSISYRSLLSAGYQTAIDHGASPDGATTFARSVAQSAANRTIYTQAIQCVAVNDAAYGTWGYGDDARAAPHGRAVRLMKYHADNRARLVAGKPLLRNIALGDWKTPGDRSGLPLEPEFAESYEFLLLPRIDLEHLWTTGEVRISGWNPAFEWTVETFAVDLPDSFGCGDGEMNFSEGG